MPLFTPEELEAMAEQLGQSRITIAGVTAWCFFDEADRDALVGEGVAVAGEVPVAKVRTGALPGLDVGVAAVVDGANYTVRAFYRVRDGAFTEIRLAAA